MQQNSAEENSLQRPTMETGLNENKNPNKETSPELPWNLIDMLIEINRAIVWRIFCGCVLAFKGSYTCFTVNVPVNFCLNHRQTCRPFECPNILLQRLVIWWKK